MYPEVNSINNMDFTPSAPSLQSQPLGPAPSAPDYFPKATSTRSPKHVAMGAILVIWVVCIFLFVRAKRIEAQRLKEGNPQKLWLSVTNVTILLVALPILVVLISRSPRTFKLE